MCLEPASWLLWHQYIATPLVGSERREWKQTVQNSDFTGITYSYVQWNLHRTLWSQSLVLIAGRLGFVDVGSKPY